MSRRIALRGPNLSAASLAASKNVPLWAPSAAVILKQGDYRHDIDTPFSSSSGSTPSPPAPSVFSAKEKGARLRCEHRSESRTSETLACRIISIFSATYGNAMCPKELLILLLHVLKSVSATPTTVESRFRSEPWGLLDDCSPLSVLTQNLSFQFSFSGVESRGTFLNLFVLTV